MKKIYTLAIALIAFGATAQYDINFDDMSLGPVSPQSPFIEMWPAAGVTDCNVVIDISQSEPNSMYVGNNQTDDVIFLLGNQASGTWTIQFHMYVDAGSTGYWNIQDNEIAGTQWNGEYYVGETTTGGAPGVITYSETGATFPYTEGEWFEVKHEINLDASTQNLYINGDIFLDGEPFVGTGGVAANALGGVNYYSAGATNSYYIDSFRYVDGILSANEFENASFSVYPNPVVDQLNIKSTDAVNTVSVFDVTGKLLQTVENSKSIDMSSYNSGIYFVEVTIGNSTQTVKVLK
ncbi:T9SS type A sorting domain-containing protein [Planktosalinus lacus]|uniref:Secretion system C-terminal sorting domain-containing protein n=1 Tax=Planktosalinus lacus TaxID=1526573 RepID=A0A8J2Y9Y9_9FLAO|nr:T9SS type A sorting domain-containing protein [Planktosalinus lacus]GGD91753.1 hypothetical protein GCM10011312_14440 [Planktosalinus lacus]